MDKTMTVRVGLPVYSFGVRHYAAMI